MCEIIGDGHRIARMVTLRKDGLERHDGFRLVEGRFNHFRGFNLQKTVDSEQVAKQILLTQVSRRTDRKSGGAHVTS